MKKDDLLKEALNETDSLLDNLKALDDETIKEKNDDIISMIERYTNMTDVMEERRNKIHENALSLVGIIVTALTIFAMLNKWDSYVLVPVVFLVTLLLTQFIIIGVYYCQNESKYVFKNASLSKYANKWKWFYYGNATIEEIRQKKNDPKVTYIRGLNFLLSKYKEEDSRTELADNIQQLYLLQVHNFYKNRYYLDLSKIQKIGAIVSLSASIIATVLVLVLSGVTSVASC